MWRKQRKHRHRLPDGRLSEQLAGVLETAWNARRGRAALPDDWRDRLAAARVDEARVEAVMPKLDELAERWHSLHLGELLILDWPRPEGRRRHHRAA
jgi:hypothetical protein